MAGVGWGRSREIRSGRLVRGTGETIATARVCAAYRRRGRPGLTRREQEVAALVAGGLTNRQIAGQLYLSVRTVETHVDHILSKLGFRTRTQLTAWAHEEGLLPRNT